MSQLEVQAKSEFQQTIADLRYALDCYQADRNKRYLEPNYDLLEQLAQSLRSLANDRLWVFKRSGKHQAYIECLLNEVESIYTHGWILRAIAQSYVDNLNSVGDSHLAALAANAFGL